MQPGDSVSPRVPETKAPRRLRWWQVLLIVLLWGYIIAVAVAFFLNQ
jgi:hypothetical protein